MFRATNSPILRSTFWLYIQLLVQCTGRQQCRCIIPKVVYTVKKCSWGWANLSPEKCRAELKSLINEKVVASCWLFTSLYLKKDRDILCQIIHDQRLTPTWYFVMQFSSAFFQQQTPPPPANLINYTVTIYFYNLPGNFCRTDFFFFFFFCVWKGITCRTSQLAGFFIFLFTFNDYREWGKIMTHNTQHTRFPGSYRRRLNFTGSALVTYAATMRDRFLCNCWTRLV